MNNDVFEYNFDGFKQYLSIVLSNTSGAKESYLAVMNHLTNIDDLFAQCYSSDQVEKKFNSMIADDKFKSWIKKSSSYEKKGFVRATKNQLIKFLNFIKNNEGVVEYEDDISQSEFRNIKRKITIKTINNKPTVLSSKTLKDYIKKKHKYSCEINDECRYFLDNSDNNYVEVHHIIPLNLQKQFRENLDVEQNMIVLCSHHHRMIHFGNKDCFNNLIEQIWKIKSNDLKEIKKDLTIDELKSYY